MATYNATYDPYGSLIQSFGGSNARLGYAGEYTDPSSLVYLRARYMNPSLGVFLSKDPFVGWTQRVMSRNGYTYAEGNPVNFTDPSGEFLPLLLGIPVIVGITAAAYHLFVDQGYGRGGRNSGGRTSVPDLINRAVRCGDLRAAAEAGGAATVGAAEAIAGIGLGPIYLVGAGLNALGGNGWTPREANRSLLSLVGLGDEYDRLIRNLYFNAGSLGAGVGTLFISFETYARLASELGQLGTVCYVFNGNQLMLTLVAVNDGQLVVTAVGAAGVSGQIVLMAQTGTGGGSGGEPEFNVQDTINDLNSRSRPGRSTKGRAVQREMDGGYEAALHEFEALPLENVETIPGGGSRGQLPDGSWVNVRPNSSQGSPTLEFQIGNRNYKYRFGN